MTAANDNAFELCILPTSARGRRSRHRKRGQRGDGGAATGAGLRIYFIDLRN